MFANVLIANRGEIACRIIRTARRMGMRSIALHTPVDRGALMHNVGRLDPDTGKGVEYPFPHAENSLRDFFMDDNDRMWFGSPANDKV